MAKCVGTNVPRLDGVQKVTGATKYIDDMEFPGCWHGDVVRSPIPYGRVKGISFDPGFDWSQVATCTYKDIPGKNATIFMTEEQPILAEGYVRHVGEAVVLVAAPTREMARSAVRHVRVEYDELKPVLTIEDSQKGGQIIFGKDNIQLKFTIEKGAVARGFAAADFVVEGEYRTGLQEHVYIEPQGAVAIPRPDGGITVKASVQCPFYVLKTLKAVLGVDEKGVNVAQAPMGGAFGGKEEYPSVMCSYVALLARKSGKAVKIIYSRDEDIMFTPKRHPSVTRHKTGVKKDGTITAMEIEFLIDGGAYATVSQVVLSRGGIHAAGVYRCENVFVRAACYATNHVPNGAFRGFGAPQAFFALEAHIDKVALAIGMDPFEFRLKNCVREGDTLSTGQVLRESVGAEECIRSACESSDFVRKWAEYRDAGPVMVGGRRIKKGIGVALFMHGGAFTGSGEAVMKARAGLRLERDGKIKILTGCTDMGQGAFTVLPQIAADALGVPVLLISCEMPDTDMVPDSGPTVASRTTMIIGNVLEKCATTMKKNLSEFAAAEKRIGDFSSLVQEYVSKKGEMTVIEHYELPPNINWDPVKYKGDAYPAYSWCADVAEVSVDVDTFEVSVDKMTVAVELGRAVNPILVEGQMEGGTLQAVGWGMMEDARYDGGRILTNRLQTYIVPTAKDAPKWDTIIIEKPFSAGPQGAKGIGELPHDGGAPAVVNAIYNALGIRVDELPATPERIYNLCRCDAGRTEYEVEHKQ